MNKTELILAISERTDLSRADAKMALDAIMDITTETLARGDKIALSGFGAFYVSKKTARIGRNFRTGAPVKIPAKKVAAFKPGSELNSKL